MLDEISSNSFSTAHEKLFSLIQSFTSNKTISLFILFISNCLLSNLYVKIKLLSNDEIFVYENKNYKKTFFLTVDKNENQLRKKIN